MPQGGRRKRKRRQRQETSVEPGPPLTENRTRSPSSSRPKKKRRRASPTRAPSSAHALAALAWQVPPAHDVLRARALWQTCFGDTDAFTEEGGMRIEVVHEPRHFHSLAALNAQAQAAFCYPQHMKPPTRIETIRTRFITQPTGVPPTKAAALIYDTTTEPEPEPVGCVIVRLGVEQRGGGKRAFVVPLLFLAPRRRPTRRFDAAALHLLNTMALALDCDSLVLEQRIKEDDLATQRRWREGYGATLLSPGGKRTADGVAVCLEHAAMVSLHKRYTEVEERRWAAAANEGGGGGDGCNVL